MRHGERYRTDRLVISWTPSDMDHPRLAVVVPLQGHTAVERNRLRRRIRETVRRWILPRVTQLDIVIRSNREAYEAAPRIIKEDLLAWSDSLAT